MKRSPTSGSNADTLRELQVIPGIGPSVARDLLDLGIRRVSDLKGRSPEGLNSRLEKLRGARMDPCVLYTFRCAVYYATASRHRPELLKWWNWKGVPSERASAPGN